MELVACCHPFEIMPTKRSSSRASRKSTHSSADSAPASPPPAPPATPSPSKSRAKTGSSSSSGSSSGAHTYVAFKQHHKFINYIFAIHISIGVLFVPLMLFVPETYRDTNINISVMLGQDLESAQAMPFDPVTVRLAGGVSMACFAILLPLLGMMAKSTGEVLTVLRAEIFVMALSLAVGCMYVNQFRAVWTLIINCTYHLIAYVAIYDKILKFSKKQ